MNKFNLQNYIHNTDHSKQFVKNLLYKQAFEEGGILHLYQELGWQGGTIHQLADKIIEFKKEHGYQVKEYSSI